MKGEGLLKCLKKDHRTKNKWITVYKARQVCDRGGKYTKEALETFAEELPEVDRKEECQCKTLYYVDPPEDNSDLPKRGFNPLKVAMEKFEQVTGLPELEKPPDLPKPPGLA